MVRGRGTVEIDELLFLQRGDLDERAKIAGSPTQRLEIAFPATLYGSPAWDPQTQQLFVTTSQSYAGVNSGLDALAVTKGCKLRLAWNRKLGGQLNSVPTVVNNTVVLARTYNATTGAIVWSYTTASSIYSSTVVSNRPAKTTRGPPVSPRAAHEMP